MMAAILAIDDDTDSVTVLRGVLASVGHLVVAVSSLREALAELSRAPVDVVVASLSARENAGLELCEYVVANRPDVPVIVMSASDEVEVAIGAIRAGAYDFLRKPVASDALLVSIRRALRRRALMHRISALPEATPRSLDEDGLVGESPAMKRVLDTVHRVALSDAALLIAGASGTGKEMIARALHRRSARRDAPFVSINCAAMPEALLESELFGHASAHDGLFRKAHGGTFFLDEIGDLPLGFQPKLLRALQERTIRPVGATIEVPVDVRIVAATNQDLVQSVSEKRFRSDLFFRVNVVQVTLPLLRARGADVILLARHFLERFAERNAQPTRSLTSAAVAMLLAYDWPGNVRELQNCIERALALGRYDAIVPDDLPDRIREHDVALAAASSEVGADVVTLRELERRYVIRVLAMVEGNKTTAARLLGIDRKTLYRKLGVDEPGKPS
jgi:two-component system response regulator HydG